MLHLSILQSYITKPSILSLTFSTYQSTSSPNRPRPFSSNNYIINYINYYVIMGRQKITIPQTIDQISFGREVITHYYPPFDWSKKHKSFYRRKNPLARFPSPQFPRRRAVITSTKIILSFCYIKKHTQKIAGTLGDIGSTSHRPSRDPPSFIINPRPLLSCYARKV